MHTNTKTLLYSLARTGGPRKDISARIETTWYFALALYFFFRNGLACSTYLQGVCR